MATFTTRLDDNLLAEFDRLAEMHRLSRNAYIEHIVRRAVRNGFLPTVSGEGFKAVTNSGGELVVIADENSVTFSHDRLSRSEQAVAVQAVRLADRGEWLRVKALLVENRFVVTNILYEG